MYVVCCNVVQRGAVRCMCCSALQCRQRCRYNFSKGICIFNVWMYVHLCAYTYCRTLHHTATYYFTTNSDIHNAYKADCEPIVRTCICIFVEMSVFSVEMSVLKILIFCRGG